MIKDIYTSVDIYNGTAVRLFLFSLVTKMHSFIEKISLNMNHAKFVFLNICGVYKKTVFYIDVWI